MYFTHDAGGRGGMAHMRTAGERVQVVPRGGGGQTAKFGAMKLCQIMRRCFKIHRHFLGAL